MVTKVVITVKLDVREMQPDAIIPYLNEVKANLIDDEVCDFFGGKENVFVWYIPVKEPTDIKVQTIELGNSFVEQMFLSRREPVDQIVTEVKTNLVNQQVKDFLELGAPSNTSASMNPCNFENILDVGNKTLPNTFFFSDSCYHNIPQEKDFK